MGVETSGRVRLSRFRSILWLAIGSVVFGKPRDSSLFPREVGMVAKLGLVAGVRCLSVAKSQIMFQKLI